MNIRKLSFLPELGFAIAHRTTREWRLGGSTRRDDDDLPAGLGRLVGLAAGLALGAGLTLLLAPEARARARHAVRDALSDRRTTSGLGAPDKTSPERASSDLHRVNGGARDSEDAGACDAS